MTRAALRPSPLVVEAVVFLAFGAPIGMIGAAWPEGRLRVDRPAEALGLVVTGYGLGRLATSATAVTILRRVAIGPATALAALLLAGSVATLAITRSFAVLVAAATALGLVSGVLDSLGNRYQTAIRDVRQAGYVFGAYGVGATAFPALVAATSWSVGFLAAAVVAVVAAALALAPGVDWPADLDERPGIGAAVVETTEDAVLPARAAAGAPTPARAPGPLPRSAVVTSLAAFALVCTLEIVTGNWAATYLRDGRGASEDAAAYALSGFWAGITLGRLVLGRLPGGPRRIVGASGLATAVLIAVVPLLPVDVVLVLYTAIGLTLAPVFPTLMSTTADRVGTGWAGRVGGWQLLSANLAGTALGALLGVVVGVWGADAIGWAAVALALVGVPVTLSVARLVHR